MSLTKDYNIDICSFSALHAALKSRSKYQTKRVGLVQS